MPISTLTTIKTKAIAAFEKIGKSNGTVAPQSSDNRSAIAHEMFIADTLASIATKRKESARAAAKEAGLLLDEYKPDTAIQIYENEHLAITAKTANSAKRLDQGLLNTLLMKELGAVKAAEIISASTVSNKPATSYIFAVK